MKYIVVLAVTVGLLITGACKNSETKSNAVQANKLSDVSVYYFHFTKRCATCMAVEENAKKGLEELYPVEISTGDYSFTSVNIDEGGKALADSLGIGGQALIVVHDNKIADITSDGFLNAHDPAKMKELIGKAVNKVLF